MAFFNTLASYPATLSVESLKVKGTTGSWELLVGFGFDNPAI
jgi:hypothetical protein